MSIGQEEIASVYDKPTNVRLLYRQKKPVLHYYQEHNIVNAYQDKSVITHPCSARAIAVAGIHSVRKSYESTDSETC